MVMHSAPSVEAAEMSIAPRAEAATEKRNECDMTADGGHLAGHDLIVAGHELNENHDARHDLAVALGRQLAEHARWRWSLT